MTDWLAKIGVDEENLKLQDYNTPALLIIAKSIIYLAEAIAKGFDKINNNLAKIH